MMMRKLIVLIGIALVGLNVKSQGSFERIIGSVGNDYTYATIQTSDGGYMVSGKTSSFGAGSNDVCLSKFDASGTLVWTKTYGGTSDESNMSMVKELSDGNYIIVAHTESFSSSGRDGYILKVDPSGNIIWDQHYSIASNETLRGVDELSNGDIVIAGACNSVIGATDAILLRLTSAGSPVYSMVYGGSGLDNFERVKTMPDGNLILAGNLSTWGPSAQNGALIKTDISGTVIWQKVYGGNGGDAIQDIEVLSDNSFMATLSGNSWGSGGIDGNIFKIDDVGNIVWAKSYGGSGDEEFKDLIVLPSGNILVYGWTTSFGAGQKDLLLVKTDESGNLIWAKTFGGTGIEPLEQGDLTFTLTDDYSLLIGGSGNSFGNGYQGVFIKTDTNGTRFCNDVTGQINTTIPTVSIVNPSVTITSAGTYSDPVTMVASPTMPVTIGCNCEPGFTGADITSEQTDCLTMSFSNSYLGTAISWVWDFGDSSTSTVEKPSHTYVADGNYTVCLTITSECGGSTTICNTISIADTCGCPGFDDVEITDSLVSCYGITFGNTYNGTITDYWWSFGDGQYSDLEDPIHHYDTAGTYWVCLTITNDCGDDTTICDSVVVSKICESFNGIEISSSLNGLSASFENSYAGTAIDWWWDFGDGQFSNLEKPTHTFGSPGTYWVCLTITNDCNQDTTICDSVAITISPKGINDFAESIGLNYYPNPANDILNIVTKANVELSIYSLTGSLVRTEEILNGNHRIDLSVLAEGVYILYFRNDSGSYQDKLIIAR